MHIGARVLLAAALLAASAATALAEGPYDNSPSYWTRVERWQDCAWKTSGSPYPPAFSYGPTHSCAYGSPGAQYYTPPYGPYGYVYYPCDPYYYH
jgi:hypothetical protein